MKGQILDFLEQKPDSNGRMLQEIWHWRDSMWESQHDFIQWLFPTDEPSQAVRNSPVLSDRDIAEIRDSDEAQEPLRKSASRYQTFLSRNRHWVKAKASLGVMT